MKRFYPHIALVAFLAMTVVGLAFGEFRSALVNAATICLSCIGIG